MSDEAPITRIQTPIRLDYSVYPGRHYARYLGGFTEGRILGATCPSCEKVYTPPRGSCPQCGVPHGEPFTVSDHGTLCSFCIIRIPFEGQRLEPPYVFGSILLDGTDMPFFHLVSGVDLESIHMGLRLQAKWSEAPHRPTVESIDFFQPNGELDADYESYREHL